MPGRIRNSIVSKFTITFAFIFAAVISVVLIVVRKAVQQRFQTQHEIRMQHLAASVHEGLLNLSRDIDARLELLSHQIARDPEFRRRAFYIDDTRNPLVIDYAGNRMLQMSLDALEIIDENGIVLSSGQNRNGFGKDVSALLHAIVETDSSIYFSKFERPGTSILCLTRVVESSAGSQKYAIAGGMALTDRLLRRLVDDPQILIRLKTAEMTLQSGENETKANSADYWQRSYRIPLISDAAVDSAEITILSSKQELIDLVQELNEQITLIGGAGLLAVIILTVGLTRTVARPLVKLADKSRRLSFDMEEIDLDVKSHDEVGLLADSLANMVHRLRRQQFKLAAAEKRAAFAQLARQVNHDIKNGFIPIRNVMRHWIEVASNEPQKLSEVFRERKNSVLDSVEYLENLARNYARLKPELNITVFSVNEVVRKLVNQYDDLLEPSVRLIATLTPDEPRIAGDATQLYRALENLLQNALDAIAKQGTVEIVTSSEEKNVLLEVRDDGCGIAQDILSRLFESHVTTKPHGTGLGLVSVRSIVQDFGGSIKVESEEGKGTIVRLTFPPK